MAKKWYQKGDEGWRTSEAEDALSKERRDNKVPFRFWQKSGSSSKLLFLDTPNFFMYEHNLQLNGKWGNFFTCLKDLEGGCPICDNNDGYPSFVAMCTVINMTPYTDTKGVVHKNRKQLFVAKAKVKEILHRRIEQNNGDLRFAIIEIARGNGVNECSTGEDIVVLGKVTDTKKLQKLVPDGLDAKTFFTPVDYPAVFAPKTSEELCRILGYAPPMGSGNVDDEDLLGGNEKAPATGGDSFDDLLSDGGKAEAKTEDDGDAVMGAASIDDLIG